MRHRSSWCASRPRGVCRLRVLLLVCAAVVPVVSSVPLPKIYCYSKNATVARKPARDRDYWTPSVTVLGCRIPKGVCIEGDWSIEWVIHSMDAVVIYQALFRSTAWLGPSMQRLIPAMPKRRLVGCGQGFCVDRADGNLIITDNDTRKDEWARKPPRDAVCKLRACLTATSVPMSSRLYEGCDGNLTEYLNLPDYENWFGTQNVVQDVPPVVDQSPVGCDNPALNAAMIAVGVLTVVAFVSVVAYLCRSAESRQLTWEVYRDMWFSLQRRFGRGGDDRGG
ncbi:m02 protein [Murid betaherpesvirus 1]|nr:m02 protein [Murid betaherpesvirus 1]